MPELTIPQAMQLAVEHHQAGRLNAAEQIYRAVLAQQPNNVDALNLLGVIADHVGHHTDAIDLIGRAIAISPNEAIFHVNYALALTNLCRVEESIASLRTAFALQPSLPPQAFLNLGTMLLMRGKFLEGWPYYDRWRNRSRVEDPGKTFHRPRWEGQDLHGKTILIYTEEGLGDAIQFVRYSAQLIAKGARVLIGCPPELARIFQSTPELGQLVVSGQSPTPFDYHISLLSLPNVLKTELATIPAQIPYLRAEPEPVRKWADRLGPRDGKLRVGLVWAGNPRHRDDRRRSMTFADFAPLAKTPDVRFYSIQKGPAAAQAVPPPPGMDLVNVAEELTDLAETAGLMMNLDLILGVDTGPMHLAGALGREVWILLAQLPDYRWMLDREDSPWYPTARLFRQKTAGDWAGVVARVAAALAELSRK
jgi:hypothetical protein